MVATTLRSATKRGACSPLATLPNRSGATRSPETIDSMSASSAMASTFTLHGLDESLDRTTHRHPSGIRRRLAKLGGRLLERQPQLDPKENRGLILRASGSRARAGNVRASRRPARPRAVTVRAPRPAHRSHAGGAWRARSRRGSCSARSCAGRRRTLPVPPRRSGEGSSLPPSRRLERDRPSHSGIVPRPAGAHAPNGGRSASVAGTIGRVPRRHPSWRGATARSSSPIPSARGRYPPARWSSSFPRG